MIADILLSSVTAASTTGNAVDIRPGAGKDDAVVQVDITAAATVVVQGRVASTMAWVPVATVTATSLTPVARLGQLRCVVSGNTGTVNAQVLN